MSVLVHIYALYWVLHKSTHTYTHTKAEHTQTHSGSAHAKRLVTLKEKEKQAKHLIIHQRFNITEININHHCCGGASVQSGGAWQTMQKQNRDTVLLVIYPTIFTKRERFVHGCVDTLKFCYFQNADDILGHHMLNMRDPVSRLQNCAEIIKRPKEISFHIVL